MTDLAPKLSSRETALLDLIRGATKSSPISIREAREYLTRHGHGHPDERTVKQMVADLRAAGNPIGASRGRRGEDGLTEAPGYYPVASDAEMREALAPYLAQLRSTARIARAMEAGWRWKERPQELEQLALIDL